MTNDNRVLIADDDPAIRGILEAHMIEWGFEIVEFANGLDAWELIKSGASPGILLLDWSMPGMDGIEICEKVRKLDKELYPYIILLTAKDKVDDIVKGMSAGADDYITKPFHPYELKVRLDAGVRIQHLQEELLAAQKKLEFEATHDSLTGVLNRRALMIALHYDMERAYREKKTLCIAIFDIDHFKNVNDTYNHLVGDEVLCRIAELLSEGLRPYDKFGRYGGEEFFLILPDCDISIAMTICERLRETVANEKFESSGHTIGVTVSGGLSVMQAGERTKTTPLIRSADEALYRAKKKGRNCIMTGM